MNKTNSSKIDSIIFDLDGTLWDASKTCTKVWNKTLEHFKNDNGFLDDTVIRSFSGLKIEIILQKYFGFIPEKDHEAFLKLYHTNEKDLIKTFGGELFPEVKEVLAELSRSYKLFVVSNCMTGYIENFMEFHNLQNIFIDFEGSGNTGLPKSENINLIIERNNLKNPIYVGDTVWDYEATQIAKVPFIYAAYGFGQVDNPDRKINSIIELEQFIKE